MMLLHLTQNYTLKKCAGDFQFTDVSISPEACSPSPYSKPGGRGGVEGEGERFELIFLTSDLIT